MQLDGYAVGFRKHVKASVEDMRQNRFIGFVKCEVAPNKSLKIPVLPDNELLFQNNKMVGTWTTLELRKALEMGYHITQIFAATSYTSIKGLMNDYIMHFSRIHICNNTPMDKEQYDAVDSYNKRIGIKDWKDISPEDTSNNPWLKHVAKLCMNSLWGKSAHRSGLTAFWVFDHYFDFANDMLKSDTLQIQGTKNLCEHCVEIKYSEPSDYVIDQ